MKNLYMSIICLIGLTIVAFPAIGSEKSTMQADINVGALPLTTQQLKDLTINNTWKSETWSAYHPEGKKRIVSYGEGKIAKRKWEITDKKGFCAFSVRKKNKKLCSVIFNLGNNNYRTYDKKGKEEFNFTILEGNPDGLE